VGHLKEVACQLFVKEEQRQVFLTINTDTGRLSFFRRWCRAKKWSRVLEHSEISKSYVSLCDSDWNRVLEHYELSKSYVSLCDSDWSRVLEHYVLSNFLLEHFVSSWFMLLLVHLCDSDWHIELF
jgi:hypothetical protein